MANWFDLSLKALSTCLIVYMMMIPILKHHNVFNIVDGIAGLLILIVSFAYFGVSKQLEYALIIAIILILYGTISYFLHKKSRLFFLLFNVRKSHFKDVDQEMNQLCEKHGLDPEFIHYREKFFFFFQILGGDPIALKKVLKELDETVKKRFRYHFAIQYTVFLSIFVILAILWRY